MYVTTILLSFLTFSCLLASLPQMKIRQIATTKKENPSMFRFAYVFACLCLSTVASLTLNERMDWAAQDPKGMYSSNKITKT